MTKSRELAMAAAVVAAAAVGSESEAAEVRNSLNRCCWIWASSLACTCSQGTPFGGAISVFRPHQCTVVWPRRARVSTCGQALWRSQHCAYPESPL